MGLRYRKSIKLAPGLRLNASLSGLSLTAGPRGASVSFGKRGVYQNLGIRGTGFSYRRKLGGVSREAQREAREAEKALQRQHIASEADEVNDALDQVLRLHLHTPSPHTKLSFEPQPFAPPSPIQPTPRRVHLLAKLFRSRREQIDGSNRQAQEQYEVALGQWTRAKEEHERAESERRELIEKGRFARPEAMQFFLEQAITALDWPRETSVSFELRDNGSIVLMDVDLPEIEDMPTTAALVSSTGLKMRLKERSATQTRKDYLIHVHAVGFRLIGVTFVALPMTKTVVLSGYSQRPERSTGKIEEEYLYSVRVSRSEWETLNFENLDDIDLPSCFERFELRRNMSATGIFKPIEPLVSPEPHQPSDS